MGDQPYTDAELDAATAALAELPLLGHPGARRSVATVALRAVLPLHAARVRQEAAEEIAQAINRTDDEPSGRSYSHGRVDAARIARSHATTPTEGGQDAQPVE